MSLVPHPTWADLPDPSAGAQTGQNDCQALAAQSLDGLDSGASDLANSIVALGAATYGDETAVSAIGDALATSADVAASLDAASLLLDPADLVTAADGLMDTLGAQVSDAENALTDVDLTPFDLGSVPSWAGGITVPTLAAPPATQPAAGGGSGVGGPFIFIPSAVFPTSGVSALVGGTVATVGTLLGTLIPVVNAFLAFNFILGTLFGNTYAQWAAAAKAAYEKDPIGYTIANYQAQIATLQQQLAGGNIPGQFQQNQVRGVIAHLQQQIAWLNQMQYVTKA